LEKQAITDSLRQQKQLSAQIISKKDSVILLKNRALDSLHHKFASLQVAYIDLEKNVFEQNQDIQHNTKNYLSQIAQRDSLLRQIISQSKSLITDNQRLTSQVEAMKSGILSASSLAKQDSLGQRNVDSLYAKMNKRMQNFIGQEINLKNEGGKVKILLAHQLLFQGDTLSQDGEFMLNMVAKALKNEPNVKISILNYAPQEVAEKDAWEASMSQFLLISKTFAKAGLKQQLTQMNIASANSLLQEVGASINRLEIWIGI
jgi:hypothetical protein